MIRYHSTLPNHVHSKNRDTDNRCIPILNKDKLLNLQTHLPGHKSLLSRVDDDLEQETNLTLFQP